MLVVTQTPDQNSPLSLIFVLLAADSDVTAGRDAKVMRAEGGEVSPRVHDGMPLTRAITRVAHEATPVGRAHDRLLDC